MTDETRPTRKQILEARKILITENFYATMIKLDADIAKENESA